MGDQKHVYFSEENVLNYSSIKAGSYDILQNDQLAMQNRMTSKLQKGLAKARRKIIELRNNNKLIRLEKEKEIKSLKKQIEALKHELSVTKTAQNRNTVSSKLAESTPKAVSMKKIEVDALKRQMVTSKINETDELVKDIIIPLGIRNNVVDPTLSQSRSISGSNVAESTKPKAVSWSRQIKVIKMSETHTTNENKKIDDSVKRSKGKSTEPKAHSLIQTEANIVKQKTVKRTKEIAAPSKKYNLRNRVIINSKENSKDRK